LLQRLSQLVIGIDPQLCGNILRAQMHNETLLRPREDPKQASVMLGVRNTEMSERLRRHGNVALRLIRPARRRAHFVSHAYIVPHATDKTRTPRPPGVRDNFVGSKIIFCARAGQAVPVWL
jgi:hypothetical protein